MTFAQASPCYFHHLGFLQGRYRRRAAIAHAGTDTTHQLVDHFGHQTLVSHTTHDAFRHQFLAVFFVTLEVAVFRAFLHRLDRAHAAVRLELTAFVNDHLAWRF